MNQRFTLKYTVGILFVLMAACFTAAADQTTPETNLSGTWASDDGTTLVITQQGPEIKIKETRKNGAWELTYFADERGETNPARGEAGELKSTSRWRDGLLIVTYSLPPTRNSRYPVKNERIDAWGISRDGKKLTHARSFTHLPSTFDPSSNPGAAPRGPAVLSAPISWKEKRTFKKVA
ncbi:MAG TPA: hypothetical protein VJP89_08655 [Pyrinomonadaceae bacterium]|nr:hypothetical protein [Pyrinomonadaceae bacterium]